MNDEAREACRGIGLTVGFFIGFYFGMSWWIIGLLMAAGALAGEAIGCWFFDSDD